MENEVKAPAELALVALELAYAYYDAPKAEATSQPEPQEYFEYFAAA